MTKRTQTQSSACNTPKPHTTAADPDLCPSQRPCPCCTPAGTSQCLSLCSAWPGQTLLFCPSQTGSAQSDFGVCKGNVSSKSLGSVRRHLTRSSWAGLVHPFLRGQDSRMRHQDGQSISLDLRWPVEAHGVHALQKLLFPAKKHNQGVL